jgi:acyl transferase domain-containing protein/SAM-dependent methyltransferase
MADPRDADLSPVKRALQQLREMRGTLDRYERDRSEPIAVVGLSCRLPGASSPEEYWRLLAEGRDAVGEVPSWRWDVDSLFDTDPNVPGKMYTKAGGFLDDVDRFDAAFFGVTPREAETMDPQQRLLLEVAWEALERGGIAPSSLLGAAGGVFVGLATSDYFQEALRSTPVEAIDSYMTSGGVLSVAAGRLSYTLGLQGPALTVDTACSSSLVAVHLACQSLRARECRFALAGGVNVILVPEITINFCRARMLAPDGRCKAFDASADGYVRSEGCGVLVLKRLSDALADGDRIHALIKGSAINQDGRSSGLTVPNGPAQEAVVREAVRQAGLAPADVQYVEAHGTGTSLGDPIEMQALGAALGGGRPAESPLIVGSAKTNLGHLEAAAGVAGLIKVVLSLEHESIPPHLHFRVPSPHIPWDRLPVEIPVERRAWPRAATPRRAGVSSFGFSGTNAHVVLEEAPAPAVHQASAQPERPVHVLALSARTGSALRTLATQYRDYFQSAGGPCLADVCHTANVGRSHFAHRLAIVAADRDEAARVLDDYLLNRESDEWAAAISTEPPTIAFLFTGLGSQYAQMGRRLYETQPAFRAAMDRCVAALAPHLDRPLLDVLYPDGDVVSPIDETIWAQPALFALEQALASLWASWGVHPSLVMGHSLGEDAAATWAGVMSLEDGLALVASRARLMQALPAIGEMVAIFAPEARVRRALEPVSDRVSIAALNGPENIAISGERQAVRSIVAELESEGVKTRLIHSTHACHSPLMDPVLDAVEARARQITFRPPTVSLASTVTGRLATARDLADPVYWRRHLREPVRFADAIDQLRANGAQVLVEIGPAPTLIALGKRCGPDSTAAWLPSLRRGHDEWRQISSALAALYVHGAPIDWVAYDAPYVRAHAELPTYPFERQRHWLTEGTRSTAVGTPADLWRSASEAAADSAARAPFDLVLSTYEGKWAALDTLALGYMRRALKELGAFRDVGVAVPVEALLAQCGIGPQYRQLLLRWLGALTRSGFLRDTEQGFVAEQPMAVPDIAALESAAAQAFGVDRAMLDYVRHCGSLVARVLTGRESPLETLFPDGSVELALGLYERAPSARYINGIAVSAVRAIAAQQQHRRLEVLEIGGGTGGTTAAILPALEGRSVRYVFTDIGELFLTKAAERFSAYDFVEYATLDLERDPAGQGFAAGNFDLVIAANVLHATRDIRATVDRALALLRPGGILIAPETTRHPSWFDVSTGLIHGWQVFADNVRSDHPLLSAEQWSDVLGQQGARHVSVWPKSGSPAAILGQHVVMAASGVESVPVKVDSIVQPDRRRASLQPAPAESALRARLAAAGPGEPEEILLAFVRQEIGRVLRIDASTLSPKQRLRDLGVDSLMAVEIRSRLGNGLQLPKKLPATLIFDSPTPEAIVQFLLRELPAEPRAPVDRLPVAPADTAGLPASAPIASMDDEQLEALLNKTLRTL